MGSKLPAVRCENQTRGRWVRSANATSVLFAPSSFTIFVSCHVSIRCKVICLPIERPRLLTSQSLCLTCSANLSRVSADRNRDVDRQLKICVATENTSSFSWRENRFDNDAWTCKLQAQLLGFFCQLWTTWLPLPYLPTVASGKRQCQPIVVIILSSYTRDESYNCCLFTIWP